MSIVLLYLAVLRGIHLAATVCCLFDCLRQYQQELLQVIRLDLHDTRVKACQLCAGTGFFCCKLKEFAKSIADNFALPPAGRVPSSNNNILLRLWILRAKHEWQWLPLVCRVEPERVHQEQPKLLQYCVVYKIPGQNNDGLIDVSDREKQASALPRHACVGEVRGHRNGARN